MQFQHATPIVVSTTLTTTFAAPSDIGIPQHATIDAASGDSSVIIPAGSSDTYSVELHQLIVTWGDVAAPGKFEIRSADDTLTLYQDGESGTLIIPCFNEIEVLGQSGLTAVNNSTGGEYSITAFYTVKEN